jgi:hypothetical protein
VRPHAFPMWREYKLFEQLACGHYTVPQIHTVDGIALAPREEQE